MNQKELIDEFILNCKGKKFEPNREFIKNLFYCLPPIRAVPLLEKFLLPADDMNAIYEVDIKKNTIDKAARNLYMTPETLKRRRNRGYDTIIETLTFL